MQNLVRLGELFTCEHPAIRIGSVDEPEVLELIRTVTDERHLPRFAWTHPRGVYDDSLAGGGAEHDTEDPCKAIVHFSRLPGRFVAVMSDLAAHLREGSRDGVLAQRLLRELIFLFERSGSHLVLIDPGEESLPPGVRDLATPFVMSPPDAARLEQLVRSTARDLADRHRIRATIDGATLKSIVRNLAGLSLRQARRVLIDTVLEDRKLDTSDVRSVLLAKRRLLQSEGLLQYVDVPVSMDEIGGLRHLKAWLARRRDALGEKAATFGVQAPRGLLMLGVQGAGKSLSAKAVATAWQRPLLRMDVGALYDRYVGESERRLRETLRQAERMAPIVLWIDEIEKAFASAASQSTDGGLSKRMFGTLLTWMQDHDAPVFLVATANDIEALPPELLRKGRFDEIFFVDLPGIDARHQIVAIHLRKAGRDPAQFDVDALAADSAGFSGSEIEQAIRAALIDAFAAREALTTRRISDALKASPPLSVTMAERIAALRAWSAGRCVPAD
jgi:AAA+ superfamily predicted ATPase